MESSSSPPLDPALLRLEIVARRAASRLRIRSTLERVAPFLLVPLLVGLAFVTYVKVGRPSLEVQGRLLALCVLCALGTLGWVVSVWFRRRPKSLGALALDRHYGFQDRITSALAFGEAPAEAQTPLMRAAIEDAARLPPGIAAREAAPLRVPQELLVALGLLGVIAGVLSLEVRTVRVVPPPTVTERLVLAPDDIALFREVADELASASKDPENLARVRQFNQLVEDMAARRLSRRDAFAALGRLERELGDAAEADREAMDEGLKNLARELEKSGLSKSLADALEEKRLADAEKALRELAEKLKSKKQKAPSKQELENLRRALERASRASGERQKALEERRQELEREQKRLLKKKDEKKELSRAEQRELDRTRRELERLDRARRRADAVKRQFSKLDRELAEAARALAEKMGGGAENLESAAEDVSRMAREELSEKEKQQLKERLKELLELLRQQGSGGQTQMDRLLKFGRRARGEGSGSGEGKDGGKGKQKGGRSQPKIAGIEFGKGAGSIPIPGSGSASGNATSGGTPSPGNPGAGAGREAGTGHDPNVRGDATDIAGRTQDVTAAGVDTGQGDASAEVIFSAAQRGFTGQGYTKVFAEYETVAEEALATDEIPPGHRFYVQRYFQLIRPRD